ncbi:MAG: hypothetical protein ACI8WB_002857 [Phenylobacterium sp.]|jgi:hypothetical protein
MTKAMTVLNTLLLGVVVMVSVACTSSANSDQADVAATTKQKQAMKDNLRAHIEFLADDLLRGRDTGSVEYEIAARYVASHFKQFGLQPAGENNSWFQSVPFTKSTPDKSSLEMIVHGTQSSDKSISFTYPEQFMSGANALTTQDDIRAKLVFVGYGIVSKEMNLNDYANLDVKGKIVVALTGRPAYLPSEQGAHVSSRHEKRRNAAERGAAGYITVHTPLKEKSTTYARMTEGAGRADFKFQLKEGGIFGQYPTIKGTAYIHTDAARQLFWAADIDLNEIFAQIEQDKVPTGFDMNVEVSLKRKSAHQTIYSSNVAGILVGSDPTLKHEYLVYSAHLDHIGVHGKGEDKINNGALDNASGIAIMLETVRRFTQGERPKRSILFVAVTAEEKGLLGSNYFARYPTVPIESMIANINLDMPIITYPFSDIIAFGAQHSNLEGFVKTATQSMNLTLSPDPMPERAIFTRSDHYSFVQQGVPAIFLVPGFTSSDPTINGAQLFGQFFTQHYHRPSDDISQPIDYDVGAVFTEVNFAIGKQIANTQQRPRWNEGDYFGDMFSKNGH